MSEEITRRKLMRAGAGTAALGAVGSLAGCSAIQDLIPGGGGGLGEYANWVYEPDTFTNDAEGVNSSAFSPSSVLSKSGQISEDYEVSIRGRTYPQLDIDSEDIDMYLGVQNGDVITGSFDTETVKSELTSSRETSTAEFGEDEATGSNEFESETTYNDDYEIFVRAGQEEPSTAIGVGNGTIVRGNRVSNGSDDAVSAEDVVTGIIDTGTNGDNRLTDEEDAFQTLVDTLNNGVYVSFRMLPDAVGSEDGPDEDVRSAAFDGLVARGQADQINGGTTKIQRVFVYDSEGDVDQDDLNEWVQANDTGEGSLSDLDDISISTDSNTATVTGTMKTIEYP